MTIEREPGGPVAAVILEAEVVLCCADILSPGTRAAIDELEAAERGGVTVKRAEIRRLAKRHGGNYRAVALFSRAIRRRFDGAAVMRASASHDRIQAGDGDEVDAARVLAAARGSRIVPMPDHLPKGGN